jgi:hypothetical protein
MKGEGRREKDESERSEPGIYFETKYMPGMKEAESKK